MADGTNKPRISRETRLLLVTIIISAAVLFLLSMLRFPESPSIVEAPPPPLERLAARAAYSDLAGIVAGLQRKISPSLVVLRITSGIETRPRLLSDVTGSTPPDEAVRHVPALRISETTAIAAVGPAARITGIVGDPERTTTARLIATDYVRQLSLVQIVSDALEPLPQMTLSQFQAPAYVVVVEGTRAGLTFRPVFIGTNDRFEDPRWDRPLLAASSIALTSPGALIFSLEGQFLGCALVEDGALAVAEATDVIATVDRLSKAGTVRPVDPGLAVQPLTPPLAAALGVQQGVVVAQAIAGGPADGLLEARDVIVGMNGLPVRQTDDFLLRLAQGPPGEQVELSVIRDKKAIQVWMTLPSGETAKSFVIGMELRSQSGLGSLVVGVAAGGQADVAGFRVGDLVVEAGGVPVPIPNQINAMLRDLAQNAYLLLRVRRGETERILALGGLKPSDNER